MKQLSPRENEVINLVSNGRKTREIAIDLGISERTVDAHRSNILQKLGAANSEHAVRLAIQHGFVSIKLGYGMEVSSNGETARVMNDPLILIPSKGVKLFLDAIDEHCENNEPLPRESIESFFTKIKNLQGSTI